MKECDHKEVMTFLMTKLCFPVEVNTTVPFSGVWCPCQWNPPIKMAARRRSYHAREQSSVEDRLKAGLFALRTVNGLSISGQGNDVANKETVNR